MGVYFNLTLLLEEILFEIWVNLITLKLKLV